MIDPEVKRKIGLFEEYLRELAPYTAISTNELLDNSEKRAAMERFFLLAADQVFDINSALAFQLGKKIPESNKSTFYAVADSKIISREFADKIAGSAKTRNQLTHAYEKMQKKLLIEEMKKFADLYKEYAKILIEKFVAEK